jgi:hypothetical protein
MNFGYTPRTLALMLLALMCTIAQADNGKYRLSAHGSPTSGVLRNPALPQGSCAQCHESHNSQAGGEYGLFEQNSNRLCFAASQGGCHADKPSGGSAGYPAQESDRMPAGSSDPGYFEFNAGGNRIAGVQNLVRWPGQLIWENPLYSPHYASPAMPIRDAYGNGACDNCHNVHGAAGAHDLTDTLAGGIVGSQVGALPANYSQCLTCHSQFGPAGMHDTSRSIAYYYDRSQNPDQRAGHGTGGSGYVPNNSRHNPHGSAGYGNAGANRYLLSDQRPGWYGLTNIKDTISAEGNDQVRRFCFGCHQSSDGQGGGTVEGMTLESLPSEIGAHAYSGSTHCYRCHGVDYSSPTSYNVHHPKVDD